MVLVNGKLLRQVLDKKELEEGRFYAAEEEELIYIFPSSDTDVTKSRIEVGIRGKGALFSVGSCHNFVIRGFIVEHSIDAGLSMGRCSNIMVSDNVCRWNNRTGGPSANIGQNIT